MGIEYDIELVDKAYKIWKSHLIPGRFRSKAFFYYWMAYNFKGNDKYTMAAIKYKRDEELRKREVKICRMDTNEMS